MGTKIVVIGGVACGPKAASRARRRDPEAEIAVIEQGNLISYAGCGMPYYVEGVIEDRNELMETPVGTILAGVHRLYHPDEAKDVFEVLMSGEVENAVIVGAGLIGMEMAEALSAHAVDITVVEMMDHLLPALLDHEPAAFLRKHLEANDVRLLTNERATAILGDEAGHVRAVRTESAELPAEFVLLAIGVRPNVDLAEAAGLQLGETGALAVDDHLQTSDPDIYAGGDCVECTNLVTGTKAFVPLGSTANKHGRVIGDNVTGGDATFRGIVCNKRDGLAKSITPAEVKAKLDAGEDFVWLDVRIPDELKEQRFEDARVAHLPLGKVRERADELPRDKEIIIFCKISLRGYETQRILEGLGFTNVRFMDGGIVAWPYGGVVTGE